MCGIARVAALSLLPCASSLTVCVTILALQLQHFVAVSRPLQLQTCTLQRQLYLCRDNFTVNKFTCAETTSPLHNFTFAKTTCRDNFTLHSFIFAETTSLVYNFTFAKTVSPLQLKKTVGYFAATTQLCVDSSASSVCSCKGCGKFASVKATWGTKVSSAGSFAATNTCRCKNGKQVCHRKVDLLLQNCPQFFAAAKLELERLRRWKSYTCSPFHSIHCCMCAMASTAKLIQK